MPVYEYRCESCSHEFEEQQEVKDKPLEICPKCQEKSAERLISRTHGFVRNITTLGQLAERNNKKIGKEKLQIEADKKKPANNIRELKKIGNMTNEQKRRYIEDGRM